MQNRVRAGIPAAFVVACFSLAGAGRADAVPAPTYQGPLPYLSAADTPYDSSVEGFCIETFEDGNFDIPGATIDCAPIGPGGLLDSVDGDDGSIDGSGTAGRSCFLQNGPGGVTVTFDPERTNGLPTEVGIVWTDGGGSGTITFDAYDKDGVALLPSNGPNTHADQSNSGTTAEDRLYGATFLAGISKIRISNSSGGIEVDHLQLNRCVICGDANRDVRLSSTDALLALKVSVATASCNLCTCDANNSGGVTSTDSLLILKKSVGQAVTMKCPACLLL